MTVNELKDLSNCDITKIDKNTLAELTDVRINIDDPIETRLVTFFAKIKNPYCFKINGLPVQIGFTNSHDKTLNTALINLLIEKIEKTKIVI